MKEASHRALEHWRGKFGAEYITRNQATEDTVNQATEVFRRILVNTGASENIESVLEVGANVGINLRGLRNLLGTDVKIAALEPNPVAVENLRAAEDLDLSHIIEGTCYDIPLPDNSMDLVFTCGVLIHIPPDGLEAAMREINRVAAKYVLCAEYFSHTPVEIPYRDQTGLLWKRDFGKKYLEVCPDLKPVAYGFIWQVEFPHYDNANWWLFSKA